MKAKLHHGSPVMVDYTPSSDVNAGDVVVVGNGIRISHRDIANGELAALAIANGVYLVEKDDAAITVGADVYWDATGGNATATAAGNTYMGKAVIDAGADDSTVVVFHQQSSPASGDGGGDGGGEG